MSRPHPCHPGPGIPWQPLEMLRGLLGVDECDLACMDPTLERYFFGQTIDPEGPLEYFVDAPGHPIIDFRTSRLEVELGGLDPEAPFWDLYWSSP